MKRLAGHDVSRPFSSPGTRAVAQIGFGALCALAMIALRGVLDMWAPHAGPFALVYPTVLIATLYGHWRAGLVACGISFAWAWYFVLPDVGSFRFQTDADASRVIVNAVSALVVVWLAETFRGAGATAMAERDAEIARRIVLAQELEHRTKNNFALAASLLDLQKRRETHPQVTSALEQAIARIRSFASAYAHLAASQGEGAQVTMDSFLDEVVERVRRGAFQDNVDVSVSSVRCIMPREVAVAIGLFTNEALINCAKYAFPDGRHGRVQVCFEGDSESWSLEITDNGVGDGNGDPEHSSTGLGTRLLAAFAQQARAEHEVAISGQGRTLRLFSTS